MVPDPIELNIVTESVVADGTVSDIQALRVWLADIIDGIQNGSEVILTQLFTGIMFAAAVIYLWRFI